MADTVGNRLGPRAVYVYVTDGGTSFNIQLDKSVASAVGNIESTTNLPTLRASGRKPIQPRYILLSLVSDPTVTKRAIICDASLPLYDRDSGGTVTINSVPWNVTGRVGEKASYLIPTGTAAE